MKMNNNNLKNIFFNKYTYLNSIENKQYNIIINENKSNNLENNKKTKNKKKINNL